MLWQGFLTACTGKNPEWKGNRFLFVLAAGVFFFLSAVPAKAEGSLTEGEGILAEITQEDWGEISYVVDFFDYDGEFLDSRICGYGEKLEDIKIPEREEDEEYTYRFTGWEPELCETVTESAAYVAVYEKIPKDGSDPVKDEELSNSQEKPRPEETHPEEPKQISAISYDVVSFVVEKSEEVPEETPPEAEAPILTETPAATPAVVPTEPPAETLAVTPVEPPAETPAEKPAETPKRTFGKIPGQNRNRPVSGGSIGISEGGMNMEAAVLSLERENPAIQNPMLPQKAPERIRVKAGVQKKKKKNRTVPAVEKEADIDFSPESPEIRQASMGSQKPASDRKAPVLVFVLGVAFGGAVGVIRKGHL